MGAMSDLDLHKTDLEWPLPCSCFPSIFSYDDSVTYLALFSVRLLGSLNVNVALVLPLYCG